MSSSPSVLLVREHSWSVVSITGRCSLIAHEHNFQETGLVYAVSGGRPWIDHCAFVGAADSKKINCPFVDQAENDVYDDIVHGEIRPILHRCLFYSHHKVRLLFVICLNHI